MEPFDLLINLQFSDCLSLISANIRETESAEEISRLLVLANIAIMEEGCENVNVSRPSWFTDTLHKLDNSDISQGIYYPILISFEAARLFPSDMNGIAENLFVRALEISTSDSVLKLLIPRIKRNSYLPLLEYCYLNMAEAYRD